ncbi:MAG: GNAT family N-acetyltransferase [candidate division Zixibacteria bacterium]|nr:GNAT family N-acetyltransferase [candidate division Zixibacteria bacterium]
MSIKIKKIQSIDEVSQLYRTVYPTKDIDKFEWLYTNNPRGNADIIAAYDSTRSYIIGSVAIIPMLINHKGAQLLIGQPIDGMVHPEFRGQGVFDVLIDEMFAQARGKYHYLIGFPNYMSRNRLVKKGFMNIGDFVTWSFPLNSKAVIGALINKPIIGSLVEMAAKLPLKIYDNYHRMKTKQANSKIIEITDGHIRGNNVASYIKRINPIMLVRDQDFIHWRLQSLPVNNYRTFNYYCNEKLLGYFCYKFANQNAEVVDFIISPEKENIEGALRLLIEHCRKEQFKTLHFQLSEHAYCNPGLKKCGFIKRASGQIIIVYPTNPESEVPDYKKFYINLADTDWV